MIFLAKKFVLSIIIRIFAATEPATPLSNAHQGGAFIESITAMLPDQR